MSAGVDWAPALELGLVGAALALVPATWVAWQARRTGLRGWPAWQKALTVATLFLTLDLVVFGAFTRLTDSGLGCPDWPGCYGHTSPFGASSLIAQAQALEPSGPVTHGKAWIEMIHRYLATTVGALITALMLGAWWGRQHGSPLSPWWPTWTFVWVCVQGAFGALTVTLKLYPLIVTLHLIGGLLGVALLTAQAQALQSVGQTAEPERIRRVARAWRDRRGLRALTWAVLFMLAVQVALGGWVSTNYAVLVCGEFPQCQGQWWPDMDWRGAFTVLRPLGEDGQGGYVSLASLTAIHVAHRLMAVALLLGLLLLAARLWQSATWRREAVGLCLLGLWQLLTGLSNVVLDWPLVAALGHTLGAALLVWWLVRLIAQPQVDGS